MSRPRAGQVETELRSGLRPSQDQIQMKVRLSQTMKSFLKPSIYFSLIYARSKLQILLRMIHNPGESFWTIVLSYYNMNIIIIIILLIIYLFYKLSVKTKTMLNKTRLLLRLSGNPSLNLRQANVKKFSILDLSPTAIM